MLTGGGSGGGVLLADQGHEVGEVVVVGVGVVTVGGGGGLVVGVGAGSSVVMATPASVLVGAVMAPPQAVVVHLPVIGTRGQMLWW